VSSPNITDAEKSENDKDVKKKSKYPQVPVSPKTSQVKDTPMPPKTSQVKDTPMPPKTSQVKDTPMPPKTSQVEDAPIPKNIPQTDNPSPLLDNVERKRKLTATSEQTEQVIDYLLKQDNATINPRLNFSENKVTYDILNQIGLDEDDQSFLDQLCTTSKSLERKHFQRLLICPKHNNFSITIHNCCMKCDAQNISKKYLIEHKPCGNIEEYETEKIHTQSTCSRCKKPITFTKKDCKTHGMWFYCFSCEEKFDKPKTELYCREGNHLLKIDDTISRDIYSYTHKHYSDPTSKIMLSVKNKIASHYTSETNVSVVGKSGITHIIDIICNINNKKHGIFLKYSDEEITEVDFHSIFLKVLDVPDLIPIIILAPSVNEGVEKLIKTHNVVAVIGKEPEEIFEQLLKALST